MNKLCATIGVVGAVAVFAPRVAEAACSIPVFEEAIYNQGYFSNKPEAPYSDGWGRSGDNEYAAQECVQGTIDALWGAYNFHVGNWNDNRGYEAPCRMDKMLGRAMTALYLLNYSQLASQQPTNWGDLSGPPLHWAGNYAHLNIDELDGECSWPSATMTTVWGPIIDNYTDVYKGGIYGHGISGRATTFLHESRHAAGYGHDGNDGSPRCVSQGSSCDESFTWSGSSGRANSYETFFSNDFHYNGQYTTTWHKQMAKDWGNWILATQFDSVPAFRI